ncbi:LysR family transcriptional regulator [Xiamenia xianingshaonis]|uniref:LysR family transcriptional regulator n=1 Tax=Xiamenia xianingshaonis TaxID=2682776 RepID=A0A9E6MQT8_9ACTN|nr:LysR family transcriptional regulator [Xiamenia xianingshaonis]NGM17566.1 LysR family transcriptional regulator [Eggerthellaceae bacterium zg-893]NHM13235.1 LysR family transcriptional regulator [Xiamenia xianingshaonis]QTU84677.1 LysR family transcriptional regulator [Xiamenia xianingshaonis]
MEFDLLREYIVLSQTLNYTKAAESLHVTQPTLSKHIASLEKELGCALFERDRRRVELTDEGVVFAAAAIQIVDTFDEAHDRIQEMATSDPIRVNGVLNDNAVSAILSIAAMILDEEGHQPVAYGGSNVNDFVQQVLEGETDIAFAYADLDGLESLGLGYIPLTRSRFVAMVPLSSSLAARKNISIDDLRNFRFVKYADNYSICGWANIEQVCHDHGFNPRTRTVLGRNATNYTAISLGVDDVVILQSSMPQLRYLSDFSKVAILPITDDDAAFRLYAIYKQDNHERVRPALDAYAQARKTIISHGKNSPLVESA